MIRLSRRSLLAAAGAVILCALVATYVAHRARERTEDGPSAPLYTFADNPTWFRAQLDRVATTGGTIRLPAGKIPELTLFALTPAAPIRLVGRPSTALAGITVKRSRRIELSDLRFAPAGAPAIAEIRDSQDVAFRHVRFIGLEEDLGVALQLDPDDRDITVEHAEFTRCQHGLACILAQGRGLTVHDVRFHTVRDADLIRGAADDVTITDSDLHDALPGTHADNHNDLIQILGGGPWTIERNHFGVRSNGAAQVYVDPRSGPRGPAHGIHIESNLFTGANPEMYFAINVRTPAESSMPLTADVAIVGNTIVSANAAAIVLADEYAKLPAAQRPLVQNNILGLQKHDLCAVARMRTNVVEKGVACPGDRAGDARLDSAWRPTAASRSLLAAGTTGGSPMTDVAGRRRASPPAIGAYELPR